MKIDENLAAVHAYLCADGYVIKNPPTQKQKYYMLGFRNTNLILLKDFQERFEKVFGIKPYLIEGQRCRLGNKQVYELLTKEFGSFYSWEWRMPELNNKLSRIWLKSYFDCEGWVTCKTHQNRMIGADCVNETGLNQVEKALNKIGIKTIRKYNPKRKIHRIFIFGKENLIKFSEEIGFLHPNKNAKLKEVLNDFIVYEWNFPENKEECKKFVTNLIKQKVRIKINNGTARIISNKEKNIKRLQKELIQIFNVESRYNQMINGIGTIYYELSINKKAEVQKLINLDLLDETEKEKWLKLQK